MAYGLFLYKEFASKSNKTIRLEIFQKDYAGTSAEIESMGNNPLVLVSDNANSGVYLPIVKSYLDISIVDTNQVDYSVFFTPDATKFKVIVKVNGTPEWSGYLTPDSFEQDLRFKGDISLTARDNLGMLSEFDYDLTNSFYSITTLIDTALTKIGFQFTLEYRINKVDSLNETIRNGLTQSKFWVGKTWQEVLEAILTGMGCQMRYVGGNKFAIYDIGYLSSLGTLHTPQTFSFIEQGGNQEIIPAWKILTINQDYGLGDNIYDGFVEQSNYDFYAYRGGDVDNPYNFYLRPFYTIPLSSDWVSTIPMLSPYEYPNIDPNNLYITGKIPETTLFMSSKLVYGKYFEAISDGKAIQFKFKANNYPHYITQRRSGEYMVGAMLRARYLYTMKVRCNLFAQTATEKYVLQGQRWIPWTISYDDALEFNLPQTKESSVYGKQGTELTSQMDSPQDQDITIEAYGLGESANVWIEFYPYTATYTEVGGLGAVDDYPAIIFDVHTMKLSEFELRIVENETGGLESKVTINANHNINGAVDLSLGEVPSGLGGYHTYLAGIFKNSHPYYPPMTGFHFAGGTNYKLSELIGREVAHHYKTQKNKLSGTIINSLNFAAMPSFGKTFTDGGKNYALNYGALDFRNETMQVELIEVEDYVTESYTFVEAEVESGGGSMGSGENEYIQWSDAGNVKRIYELATASESERAGSYVMVDKSGLTEAKKVDVFALLDQKEDLLPATPSDPESKFLNGNKEWSLINLGSGGNSPKVFFTSIASDVATYKELSYEPEATTSYCTTVINNTEVLCSTFLYPLGVGVELLDAGTWEFDIFGKVSGTAGNVTMRVEVFKRTTGGVESVLFSKSSDIINNTDYEYIKFIYTSPSIAVNSTDRIGVKVYGKNTIAAAITLSWALGDGDASYFVTPLAMRHAQLRGKNDEAGFQHITQSNQTFEGIKTFSGAFTDMVENRNTNLRLPKVAPTSATADEFYLYSLDSGFSGELPSGAGSVTSIALTMPTGFSVSGSPITESGTFGVTFASGYFLPTTTQFATKLDVSLKGTPNGLAELDENGFVKNTQLPSYVDDVLEYGYFSELPVTGTSGKIYVITNPLDTDHYNKTYRWSGTIYTEISQSLALGETSSTAYRGDRGKIAYDHSQLTGNPHGATTTNISEGTNLYYTDTRVKAHGDTLYTPIAHGQITSGNPHGTTAADVGALGINDRAASAAKLAGYENQTEYIILEPNGNINGPVWKIRYDASTANRYIDFGFVDGLGGFSSGLKIYNNTLLTFADGDVYHEGNSNLSTVNWSAAKLTSTTLLLPQTAPSLASGEMAIYGLESGFSGELPSGAGSVDSVALVSNLTGISVTGSPITTSGTFTLNFVSGYQLMTTTESTKLAGIEANANNYSLPIATASVLGGVKIGSNITITDGVISVAAPHNAVTLGTANGLSLSTQVLSLGLASATTNGALSSTDWSTFNGKEPAFSKNTAFNKNFGTTAGTVLEGRTFGTAAAADTTDFDAAGAASTVQGNLNTHAALTTTAHGLGASAFHADSFFIQNQSSAAQSANMWINGVIRTTITDSDTPTTGAIIMGGSYVSQRIGTDKSYNVDVYNSGALTNALKILQSGAATFASTVSATGFTENGTALASKYAEIDGNASQAFSASTVTMTENINTNLRIPKVAPASPTSGEYYFYIVE